MPIPKSAGVEQKAREICEQIGARIAELRREKGWSQKDFSGVLHSSVQWISLVETGRQNLTVHTIVRIAAKLDVDPVDLWRVPAPEKAKLKRGKGRPRRAS